MIKNMTKVGDWLCEDELLNYFESTTCPIANCNYNYIYKSKDFICKGCITKNQVEEITPFKKNKKIPYTLETFPENALWVRHKKWLKKEKAIITSIDKEKIIFNECDFSFSDDYVLENYEIGCQVIKDGKIEIEWLPFYQEI